MTVAITWALSALGTGISEIDHGNVSSGAYTAATQVYVRHDGANPITNCGFYFAQKASGYAGAQSAALDYSEIISEWGDESVAADHGGIQVNMDPDNLTGYNASTWGLSESTKQTTVAFTAHSGVGNNAANKVFLKEHMDGTLSGGGMPTDGEIPSGIEVSFLCRFQIPTNEAVLGIREIDQVLAYTYTS